MSRSSAHEHVVGMCSQHVDNTVHCLVPSSCLLAIDVAFPLREGPPPASSPAIAGFIGVQKNETSRFLN